MVPNTQTAKEEKVLVNRPKGYVSDWWLCEVYSSYKRNYIDRCNSPEPVGPVV